MRDPSFFDSIKDGSIDESEWTLEIKHRTNFNNIGLESLLHSFKFYLRKEHERIGSSNLSKYNIDDVIQYLYTFTEFSSINEGRDIETLVSHYELHRCYKFKEHLLKLVDKSVEEKTESVIENIENEDYQNRTIKLIETVFRENGYEEISSPFTFEEDSKQFFRILKTFYEQKRYHLPSKTLKIEQGNKTKLAKTFKSIHKQLKETSIAKDKELHQILRTLSCFSDDRNIGITLNRN